ncbi:kinase-like domain-containing protein [Amylocarpus encephaloides]|uniref:Kinase-like domain-containing protein n=1 Tax=Amylocarpus encephaloides TaxID=45428 RepID=A0A9P7YNT1_9HELO|nr:kinase-like domain-containing protein [Amylocarpus encephaloides]
MGDTASWVSTEPSTRVRLEREAESRLIDNPNSEQPSSVDLANALARQLEAEGRFARLVPQNRNAREAFQRSVQIAREGAFQHHAQFIHAEERDNADPLEREDYFVFSLGLLPEFPALGWRIGKGRSNKPNHSVDILVHDGEGVAGVHARFCWVKGGGGFFLVADNLRDVPVMLNGETLKRNALSMRLIPFRNSISIGECNFSVQFQERSSSQEEQFQVELSAFYAKVMRENAPLLLPTPSGHETTIGNWIVRNPLASGSYGRVSLVSHMHTGQPAAAKELWRTERNRNSVDREVYIAKHLGKYKHKRLGVPFEFYHKKIVDKAERARYAKMLDENWSPGHADAIDLHILYSPLSTSNFLALIKSKASLDTRTQLFAQVLDGIAFLHSLGIAHRDIKPGNLTVRSYDPPDAQIIDFGCATRDPSTIYDRPGTIPYLAPEQVEGKHHDRTVDYWACALVGAELVGLRRKSNERIAGESYAHLCAWLDEQPSLPLIKVAQEMLQVEPTKRLTAADALVKYLLAFHEVNKGRKRVGDMNGVSSSKGVKAA